MRMMQFTPKFPSTKNQSDLARAIATALLIATSGAVGAATVNPGQTVTVTSGSPLEGQSFNVNGGTLIVQGATTGRIDAVYSSGRPAQLILTNAVLNAATSLPYTRLLNSSAVIRDSTINDRFLLATTVGANGLPRSHLLAVNSQFGMAGLLGFGANAGATLDAEGSRFVGTYAVMVGGAVVNLRSGSLVSGETNGLRISYGTGTSGQADNQSTWGVLVDASRVEGATGAAISIGRGNIDETVRITAQNGATLTGGNGVMIEARDNALLDFTARTSILKGDITIADTATAKISLLDGLDLTGRILGRLEEKGLKQVTDTGAIEAAVDQIIAANPDKVAQYKAKPTMLGWFVGQVMKATQGKANPAMCSDALKKKLDA